MNVFTRFGRSTLKTRFLCLYPKVQTVSLALLIPLMCLYALQQGFAQANPAATASSNIQPLNIGDPIPDEVWNMPLSVVNHPDGKETITLADYKDKLIIIDFWATWCKPCITSLYKLDTLQGQFADDIAIIPTTYEDASKVGPFIEQRGWSLLTAVSETALKKYFHYLSIPHQIWIKGGEVVAIVGPEYANSDYIGNFLNGKDVGFKHKIEVEFDRTKPLFLNGNGGDGSNMLYQSVISGKLQARISGISRPSPNEILLYNSTVELLYKTALENSDLIPIVGGKYIIYDVHDTLQYRLHQRMMLSMGDYSMRTPWAEENTYCFNFILPVGYSKEFVSNRMFRDLNDFFENHLNIKVSIEARPVMALVLIKTENYQDISTKGGESFRNSDLENEAIIVNNQPLNYLLGHVNAIFENSPTLNTAPYIYPIIDETGISGNVDITLSANFTDIESIREAFKKYGLDLVEKISPVKMIVFSYSQYPNQ